MNRDIETDNREISMKNRTKEYYELSQKEWPRKLVIKTFWPDIVSTELSDTQSYNNQSVASRGRFQVSPRPSSPTPTNFIKEDPHFIIPLQPDNHTHVPQGGCSLNYGSMCTQFYLDQ